MLHNFLLFLLQQLFLIHSGSIAIKIKASFFLGLSLSPVAFLIENINNWYVTNYSYILWVSGAILVDWAIGTIKHLIKKTFDIKMNATGIILKTAMAFFAGILFEGLTYFTKDGNLVTASLMTITRLSIFIYPAGSALMNMSVITNGVFPPIGWINKIKYFNENLKLPKDEPTL